MAQHYDVTSVGVNPAEDRAHRMRMYLIAMSLRVACVVSLIWVRGWWILLVGIGAVVLPYVAVLVGNAVAHGNDGAPTAPSPLELADGREPEQGRAAPAAVLIVVDAPESSTTESSTTEGGAAEGRAP